MRPVTSVGLARYDCALKSEYRDPLQVGQCSIARDSLLYRGIEKSPHPLACENYLYGILMWRTVNPIFEQYIGIDYSGAQTPKSSLKGLRIYKADCLTAPEEVEPPSSPRRYWTRRGIAEWLVERLSEGQPTLVGIDHGFSFPLRYFEQYGLPLDWPSFLDDFQLHWPTDEDIYVDFVRDGSVGNCAARSGNPRWRRVTELRARSAKSVFHFDVQGSVAKFHARRHSVAPVHKATCQRPRPFLALRRLGNANRQIGNCRSLSGLMEPQLFY